MTLVPGQRVRVSDRTHRGHHRTPGYVKGSVGVIERRQGDFTNPETRAYGKPGLPERALYLVRFESKDVWPGAVQGDRIYVDVFEQWLEEAE